MARFFNGPSPNTDTVILNSSLTLSSSNPFTISAWVYTSTINVHFQQILSGQFGEVCFQINDGEFGTTAGNVSLVKKSVVAIGTGSTVLSTNAWHHVGCSYDGTNWATYVDGISDGSGSNAQTIGANANALEIGNDLITLDGFSGRIADAAIWNIILNASEFAAMFRGVRPSLIRPKSLSAYLPLDGIQSPEPDLSGNAYNGTLTGTTNASGPPVTLFTRYPPALIPSVGVFVYARPDADNIDGGWVNETGGSTLFSSIDETSFDDADYIISSNNPSSDLCKISLSDPAGSVGEPATVRYRYCKRGEASFQIDLQVTLLQGVTTIAQWTHTNIGTSFITAEQVLTTLQFNAISDFTDLFLQFSANKV